MVTGIDVQGKARGLAAVLVNGPQKQNSGTATSEFTPYSSNLSVE
jgi:hypothetical protein